MKLIAIAVALTLAGCATPHCFEKTHEPLMSVPVPTPSWP